MLILQLIEWVVPEKIHTPPLPPRLMGLWKFLWEGGSKTPEIPGGRGLNLKKSSAGIIFTDSSCDLNEFGDTSVLSDPENSRNILFTYFSPDINDNLSSFAGPFIVENANNKILKNELSQHRCNEEFETNDTFLLIPRPRVPRLCNFIKILEKE